tara:strand:+ start:3109 stop:3918 length:810 start_codon:yes stop_codon:yes gene_type:complete
MSEDCSSKEDVKQNMAELETVAQKSVLQGVTSLFPNSLNKVDTKLLSAITTGDPIPMSEKKKAWKAIQPKVTNNIDTIKIIEDAIIARHKAFKDSNNFETDCSNNVSNTIDSYIEQERQDINRLKSYMESYLSSYRSLFNYKSSLRAIISEKFKQLGKIKNKIDTYKQNLYMDNRKDSYQQKNYEFYKNIHFFILIVFYSIFVLYLIFSNYLREEGYKNKYLTTLIILYLILPFILPYILYYIHNAYIYILEYNNLRDEVISYPYIINE